MKILKILKIIRFIDDKIKLLCINFVYILFFLNEKTIYINQ